MGIWKFRKLCVLVSLFRDAANETMNMYECGGDKRKAGCCSYK